MAALQKKPCTFFLKGVCTKGDACPYMHAKERRRGGARSAEEKRAGGGSPRPGATTPTKIAQMCEALKKIEAGAIKKQKAYKEVQQVDKEKQIRQVRLDLSRRLFGELKWFQSQIEVLTAGSQRSESPLDSLAGFDPLASEAGAGVLRFTQGLVGMGGADLSLEGDNSGIDD